LRLPCIEQAGASRGFILGALAMGLATARLLIPVQPLTARSHASR
jgi:hypothetical protein